MSKLIETKNLKYANKKQLRDALNEIEKQELQLKKKKIDDEKTAKYHHLVAVKGLLTDFLISRGLDKTSAFDWLVIKKDGTSEYMYNFNLYFQPCCHANHLLLLISKFIILFHHQDDRFSKNSIEYRLGSTYKDNFIRIHVSQDGGLEELKRNLNL